VKIALALVSVVAVLALIAAGTFGALYASERNDDGASPQACSDRIFGHVSSLDKSDDGTYRMRFDPAWFTSGVTANDAAAEDGVVEPGEPVPNDNYRVEEGHRLLTYIVPAAAHVTVLTNQGDPAQFGATAITVAELAQLVAGEKPVELFEPLDSGMWVQYGIDTVCSLEQQYQP
jgi:hypothetical protein